MADTIEDPAAVDSALQQLREMLESDGYLVKWTASDAERLVVQIEAGEDACADCLVPLPVMETIVSNALASTPYSLDHVVLPNAG